jgi:hypothetical protein
MSERKAAADRDGRNLTKRFRGDAVSASADASERARS